MAFPKNLADRLERFALAMSLAGVLENFPLTMSLVGRFTKNDVLVKPKRRCPAKHVYHTLIFFKCQAKTIPAGGPGRALISPENR